MPDRWQLEMKRIHFGRQIKKGRFVTDEPEYQILHELIRPGDWVIDVGANVGHYTKRFSDLVGVNGRVIAFEPVPTTFSLLSANAQLFTHPNVSLINAAVSCSLSVVGMSIPRFSTGLANYYQAHITGANDSIISVLGMSVDSLRIAQRVALVKIDAEGHETAVLDGMAAMIESSRPVLIVETGSEDVIASLESRGYLTEQLPGSPNLLFRHNAR